MRRPEANLTISAEHSDRDRTAECNFAAGLAWLWAQMTPPTVAVCRSRNPFRPIVTIFGLQLVRNPLMKMLTWCWLICTDFYSNFLPSSGRYKCQQLNFFQTICDIFSFRRRTGTDYQTIDLEKMSKGSCRAGWVTGARAGQAPCHLVALRCAPIGNRRTGKSLPTVHSERNIVLL